MRHRSIGSVTLACLPCPSMMKFVRFLRAPHTRMTLKELDESLGAISYRLAIYCSNNLIDDPAMLALIFC